jgi:hypothetical protein
MLDAREIRRQPKTLMLLAIPIAIEFGLAWTLYLLLWKV